MCHTVTEIAQKSCCCLHGIKGSPWHASDMNGRKPGKSTQPIGRLLLTHGRHKLVLSVKWCSKPAPWPNRCIGTVCPKCCIPPSRLFSCTTQYSMYFEALLQPAAFRLKYRVLHCSRREPLTEACNTSMPIAYIIISCSQAGTPMRKRQCAFESGRLTSGSGLTWRMPGLSSCNMATKSGSPSGVDAISCCSTKQANVNGTGHHSMCKEVCSAISHAKHSPDEFDAMEPMPHAMMAGNDDRATSCGNCCSNCLCGISYALTRLQVATWLVGRGVCATCSPGTAVLQAKLAAARSACDVAARLAARLAGCKAHGTRQAEPGKHQAEVAALPAAHWKVQHTSLKHCGTLCARVLVSPALEGMKMPFLPAPAEP